MIYDVTKKTTWVNKYAIDYDPLELGENENETWGRKFAFFVGVEVNISLLGKRSSSSSSLLTFKQKKDVEGGEEEIKKSA